MNYLIWRLRFTLHAFRGGYALRDAWQCSGYDEYWREWSPEQAASEELSYARHDMG